jgi:hypothetical protein
VTSLRKLDACRTLAAGDGSAHLGGDDPRSRSVDCLVERA